LTTKDGEHFGEEAGTGKWRQSMLKALNEQQQATTLAARPSAPTLPEGVMSSGKLAGSLPPRFAERDEHDDASDHDPMSPLPQAGTLAAKAAEAQRMEISNKGSIDINVRAAKGTSVKAGGDGPLFDTVRLNGTHAGEASTATSHASAEEE
jgi:hypothetical protein